MIPARPACSFRRATRDDAGGILGCLHAAFEPYRDRYTPDAFRDTVLTPETVQLRLAAMAVFVAVAPAGEIVGTIGCGVASTEEGHIRGMAVLPGWQGAGLADDDMADPVFPGKTQDRLHDIFPFIGKDLGAQLLGQG
jgi:GNAT superfamily N-acetyltransferase